MATRIHDRAVRAGDWLDSLGAWLAVGVSALVVLFCALSMTLH